ncbi:MAG: cobyrinate a,c-diamide synthase [Acidimicrobiales bacterium]
MAGTHSGVGKTTLATGLMAAFSRRGTRVASAKVGPDFIDPGYHGMATGKPGRNLDPWICGSSAMAPLAARAGADAWSANGIMVIEGVMGLFDGSASQGPESSTAEVAKLLDAPVVLVVDAAKMSTSVAALVGGFAHFDPDVNVAGVILNRVGSDTHEAMLRGALDPLGLPVLGVLRRDEAMSWRDRHLGLVPVVEQPVAVQASLDRLAAAVAAGCDLDGLAALARSAPRAPSGDITPTRVATGTASRRPRIAVAGGTAFSFSYPDNLERLEEAGAEIVSFDPLLDTALPERTDALCAGGGFPEVFGEELASNRSLLDEVAARVRGGLPTWLECGGMLWLSASLDGHPMAGALPVRAEMGSKLVLGYRRATVRQANPVAGAGAELRGHVFHYSVTDPPGEALDLSGGLGRSREGFASPSLLASYLHLHLGADPRPAECFVATLSAQAP